MKNLLVVIDMVNGFVNFGALADKNIDKITPTILDIMREAKKNNFGLLAFKDCHAENDEEFKTFPPHCIKGTAESELIPQLKEVSNMFDFIIDKNTTNGFVTKQFQNLLKINMYDNVLVCGCCTDICVSNFVKSYIDYIKKEKLPTKVVVFENACYTFDGKGHDAEEFHKNSIQDMKNYGAKIAKYPIKMQEEAL